MARQRSEGASATMDRPKRGAKDKPVHEFPVDFGGISIGDKTARVGVAIDRANLTPAQADKAFCGRRLTGKIIAKPPGEQDGQGYLAGADPTITLTGIFDVKGFSVTGRKIGFGLTFNLKDLNVEQFSHFAKQSGSLVIDQIEDLPEDADEAEEPAGEEE